MKLITLAGRTMMIRLGLIDFAIWYDRRSVPPPFRSRGFRLTVGGRGLFVKIVAPDYVPYFSERYGYVRAHYFFGRRLRVEFLRREGPTFP